MAARDMPGASAKRTARERRATAGTGAAARRKRTFREVCDALLNQPFDMEPADEAARKIREKNGSITVDQAIAIAQIVKAIKGDTAAFNAIRDTMGEKQANKARRGSAAAYEELLKKCGGSEM